MKAEKKLEDELLTKVLREPFVYHTPTVDPPSDENTPHTSHNQYQFDEKDYLSKYSEVFSNYEQMFAYFLYIEVLFYIIYTNSIWEYLCT